MKISHGSDVEKNFEEKEVKDTEPKIKDVFIILKNVHPLGKIPEKLKGLLLFAIIITIFQNVINSMFVFFLEWARGYVAEGEYVIGLICFSLYVSRYAFSGLLRILQNAKNQLLSMKIDLNNQEISTIVLGKVSGKVSYSSRIIKDTVFNYFSGIYTLRKSCIATIITLGTSLLSMFTTIYIVVKKDNSIYSFFTVVIILISYFVFLLIDSKMQKLWNEGKVIRKEVRDKSRNCENDLVNLSYISKKHFNFLSNRFLKAENESMDENYKLSREIDKVSFYRECVSIISLLIILLIQFAKLGGEFSLDVFLELISLYIIMSTLMSTAGGIVSSLSQLKQHVTNVREEELVFEDISYVYEKENEKQLKEVESDYIEITPYDYTTEGFSLLINNPISLKKGQMILLNGESGSGKSTLIDLVTGQKGNIGYNINVTKYRDGAKLGSGSILEEIIWEDDLDENKLIEVLKGTQIYNSLKGKADSLKKPLITYLSGIDKTQLLSSGEEQRVVLASLLYHLDNSSDLLLFDEPISAIDEKKAIKIIAFIKKYCNRDRKRFILLATHQYKWILKDIDAEVKFKKISETQTVIG